jgi:hypothetical protein
MHRSSESIGPIPGALAEAQIAVEAANVFKAGNPYSKIVIRDMRTGEATEMQPRKPTI